MKGGRNPARRDVKPLLLPSDGEPVVGGMAMWGGPGVGALIELYVHSASLGSLEHPCSDGSSKVVPVVPQAGIG